MFWSFLQMIFSLAVVLGLMFALLFFLKKYLTKTSHNGASAVPIEILGCTAIQPKKSIIAVNVSGKVLVLGSTENGITTLAEFSEKESAKINKKAAALKTERNEAPASFSEYFTNGMRAIIPNRPEGRRQQ